MKVKDLIHELYYFNDNDEIFALYYDKDDEYECNIEVKGDAIPILILEKKEEKYEN